MSDSSELAPKHIDLKTAISALLPLLQHGGESYLNASV